MEHVLMTSKKDCQCADTTDGKECPVCEWGASVCVNCGAAEAELQDYPNCTGAKHWRDYTLLYYNVRLIDTFEGEIKQKVFIPAGATQKQLKEWAVEIRKLQQEYKNNHNDDLLEYSFITMLARAATNIGLIYSLYTVQDTVYV